VSARTDAGAGSWLDRISTDAKCWDALSADPAFASAAAWFDTTIVIESGDRAMFLKIYRGRIIDSGRGHGVLGYQFALGASEATWTRVLSEGSAGLHRALNAGDVRPRGDLIEFNRATKLVSLLVDHLSRTSTAVKE
jgi:hypothetical protein